MLKSQRSYRLVIAVVTAIFFSLPLSLSAQDNIDMGRGKRFMIPPANVAAPKTSESQLVERPDAPDNSAAYIFTTNTSGTFTNMTSGTTHLLDASNDDVTSPNFPIGFEFWLRGPGTRGSMRLQMGISA